MTVWLTRIAPDPRSPQARSDTSGSRLGQGLHQRLMALFPRDAGPDPRARFNVLFRTEDTPHGLHLLMQSTHEPDLSRLPVNYGTSISRPLDALLDALRPGLTIRYRCVANAVRRPGHTTRAHYNLPAVVPLHGAAADAWWERQAESAGLALHTVESTPLDAAGGRHGGRGTTTTPGVVRHARTRFDGIAAITDPHLLRQKVTGGIGRGKAYGCGLLTIAPARGTR
ncbi:type I-E CRISPR-associated protein Cas6/Cse3/CasE [Streptomyces sp. NPDC007084]|uniref:type I-E CRISPR-associated protein Cas6/Cse3/CasE n=1 Tax=Streptomyces sp. NPDC007084 TaxID=3154313 RepID=UPI0034567FA6